MIPVLQTDLLISLFEVMKGPVCQRSLAGTPKRSLDLNSEESFQAMSNVFMKASEHLLDQRNALHKLGWLQRD